MDSYTANTIKSDIENALSPFNPHVRYVKPQYGKIGYFEVGVDDYLGNSDVIKDSLRGVLDKHSLFFDNDSDADFNLGADWDD